MVQNAMQNFFTFSETAKIEFENRTSEFLYRIKVNNIIRQCTLCIDYLVTPTQNIYTVCLCGSSNLWLFVFFQTEVSYNAQTAVNDIDYPQDYCVKVRVCVVHILMFSKPAVSYLFGYLQRMLRIILLIST